MPRRLQPVPGGFGRGPRIADLMTAEYHSLYERSWKAERAGDAAAALAFHRRIPMFRRSAHAVVLSQLVDLADQMTPWLWARWAAYQCTRAEDQGTDAGDINRASLQYVVQMFHGREMQRRYDAHEDPVPFMASTAGEDWAFHQICTFEMGGLETFVEDLATARLAEEVALAHRWRGCPVSGYTVARADPMRLAVRDLATGQEVEVLDLGVGAVGDPWLLGRLVPSGTEPAWMFDTTPLQVDERTARAAAGSAGERGGWITALAAAMDAGRLEPAMLRREDRELATDIASLRLIEVGTAPAALERTMASLRNGRDEVGRAAFRILRAAAEGRWADERAAYLGAAALNPHGYAAARRSLGAPRGTWEHWARLVAEPARTRLRLLAEAGTTAA